MSQFRRLRHIQVKRSLNKRCQPSQCKNKYQSSGHSRSCAAPQVPSAASNSYKSVQRECVGVSVNGCALGGTVVGRCAKSELQTTGQGRGAALREALKKRATQSRRAFPHTLTAEFVIGRVKKETFTMAKKAAPSLARTLGSRASAALGRRTEQFAAGRESKRAMGPRSRVLRGSRDAGPSPVCTLVPGGRGDA